MALEALIALAFRGHPFHDSFHGQQPISSYSLGTEADRSSLGYEPASSQSRIRLSEAFASPRCQDRGQGQSWKRGPYCHLRARRFLRIHEALSARRLADPATAWQRPGQETLELIWHNFREAEDDR